MIAFNQLWNIWLHSSSAPVHKSGETRTRSQGPCFPLNVTPPRICSEIAPPSKLCDLSTNPVEPRHNVGRASQEWWTHGEPYAVIRIYRDPPCCNGRFSFQQALLRCQRIKDLPSSWTHHLRRELVADGRRQPNSQRHPIQPPRNDDWK